MPSFHQSIVEILMPTVMSHMCVCVCAHIVFIYDHLYFYVCFVFHNLVRFARSRFYRINEFLVCVSFSLYRTYTPAAASTQALARWLRFEIVCLLVYVCLFYEVIKITFISFFCFFGCGIRVRSVFVIGLNEVFEVHTYAYISIRQKEVEYDLFFTIFSSVILFPFFVLL